MFLGGYNDCTSIRPRSMPLCELPVPQVFREFLEHDTPHGYGFNPRWTAQLNHYNVTFQRSIYVVTDTYEAEDGPELMLRWYACRNTQKRGFELVEIMRQSPSEEWCYYRNAYYRTLAGWQFVYRDEEKKTRGGYYGYNYTLWEKGWFNKWIPEVQKKAPGFTAYWINPAAVLEIPRYRYSGWQHRLDLPVISYLKQYRKNPGIEFFGKLGIMPTKALVDKATKDGNFRRFLRDHAHDASLYGAQITLHVYRHRDKTFEDAYEEINAKARASRKIHNECYEAKTLPKSIDRRKLWEYAEHVGARSYNDYLNAVKFLQLDVTDTKVLFPNDFHRMHDLRINEAAARRAKENEEKTKEFAKKFAAAAVDYAFANYAKPDDAYIVLIPVAPSQLVAEGDALSHCVGKMGYDNRMIAHTSFIAFLRKADEVDKPFVTIEFNLDSEKIVQIYGAHDKRPPEEVIAWAAVWESAVKKILDKAKKQLAKEARSGEKVHNSIYEYIREAKLAA
ncbi:MAG: PcfJ domain-containing protein [Lachnospiraceae bacterium]|nr:PcfJ domain-containing protein [Lachnospiraceae bacterium]